MKRFFFFFLNFYLILICSSYSTPILLLPIQASKLSLSNTVIAIIFSSFPIGAFPASLYIGKLMRFYKKDKLLLLFNGLSSFFRFCFGLSYFIDNSTYFSLLTFTARMFTGLSEGSLVPIIYSFVPEIYPEESMLKYGILEISGSVGMIIGAPIASFIFENLGYFEVFTIMALSNFILGSFIILYFLKTESLIVKFQKETKEPLAMKKALFENKAVIINFFYLFFFYFPMFMIQAGFEDYISTLSSSLYISSFLYGCLMFGLIIGVFIVHNFYRPIKTRKMLFISGIIIIIALTFYGPDPLYDINDNTIKIILIAFAFLFAGTTMEIIFLIVTKVMVTELLEVFPGENELCIDFANGMFIAAFTSDQFFATVVGGVLNDLVGYSRTGVCYSIITLSYFIFYWIINKERKISYDRFENFN